MLVSRIPRNGLSGYIRPTSSTSPLSPVIIPAIPPNTAADLRGGLISSVFMSIRTFAANVRDEVSIAFYLSHEEADLKYDESIGLNKLKALDRTFNVLLILLSCIKYLRHTAASPSCSLAQTYSAKFSLSLPSNIRSLLSPESTSW